jgi:hypothetical protein
LLPSYAGDRTGEAIEQWIRLEAFTTLRGVRKEEMSSAIGIEKKAVTLTMGANEDA